MASYDTHPEIEIIYTWLAHTRERIRRFGLVDSDCLDFFFFLGGSYLEDCDSRPIISYHIILYHVTHPIGDEALSSVLLFIFVLEFLLSPLVEGGEYVAVFVFNGCCNEGTHSSIYL